MKKLARHWPLALAALLALGCAFCVWRLWAVSNLLTSQQAAKRWQGEGEQAFAQLSCFMAPTAQLTLDDMYKFRGDMAQKLKGAGYDTEKAGSLYRDAWSAFLTVKVSRGRQSGEVQAVAVGGNFFDFHPLRLVSGSYLSPADVMDDRVLLDQETAWLLFGAADVAGLSFSLEGVPFVVAGVYAHEGDSFSRLAYGSAMRIYMSFSALKRLASADGASKEKAAVSDSTVTCYELVMAEPVKGFAYSSVTDKFPNKNTAFAENTYRFEPERLFRLLRNRTERSMRTGAYYFPYWENAARAAEDRAAFWLAAAAVTGALPAGLLIYGAVRAAVLGKRRLEGDVLPGAQAKSREFFRAQSRRRWEKKHPGEY